MGLDPNLFIRIVDPDKPGASLILAKRDFDSTRHRLFGDGSLDQGQKPAPAPQVPPPAPAPPARPAQEPEPQGFDETPGSIATVNMDEALALIARAKSESELEALEDAEMQSLKNRGGRRSILRAIKARRSELGR
jgi:hypothetical protein